ncbi:MAG TPA: response regulator transcription factor [Bacteroidales bacterium]|nr:response regulator transcription factor [Bacteroidales bacterium]HSA44464.1 response regulator transcription factor [Bacteroidales bacterium]
MEQETIRVAIVEDDQTVLDGLKMLIGGTAGYSCVSASCSGEDAIEVIPALNPDVVLMDINLPGIDGIECLLTLKTANPALQIIMLTIYEDSEAVFKSLAAGASGYLLKQTSPSRLLEAIREVYLGGSPMSGEIARKVVQSFQSQPPNIRSVHRLTKREEEVLAFLAKGYFYKEIADTLFISVETVRTHIRNIYEKLQVRTRTEAILKFLGKYTHT